VSAWCREPSGPPRSQNVTADSARILVIAGVASGVGKTTLTLGLLEALRRRGLVVQAFKVGPDFIDPGLHTVCTGRPSYTLDGWMCGRTVVLDTVATRAAGADVAIVEGMMGCFDGVDGKSEDGSTAQIAKWLGAAVVLVVDAAALARSAGALVLGFERFDPELNLAAVIFNRVGGDLHARWLREAVEGACRALPVGCLPRHEELTMPERHLGLATAEEGALGRRLRDALAETVQRHVDLDRLLTLAAPLPVAPGPAATARIAPMPQGPLRVAPAPDAPPRVETAHDRGRHGADRDHARDVTAGGAAPSRRSPAGAAPSRRARIGVARDRAFQFYYPDTFDRLRAAGAELVFWSPLDDAAVPAVDGLYLGGGYPELYARQLAANEGVRAAVARLARDGLPIYAECGGLMYLAESLEDLEGARHPMVGVLPAAVRMRPPRLTLGYAEVEFAADTLLGPVGAAARGHEFHYSTPGPVPESVTRVYRVRRRGDPGSRAEGFLVGRTLMSYVHLHFASSPAMAARFVQTCLPTGR
jgi:cobyrinic acid a,c-diamide synthase